MYYLIATFSSGASGSLVAVSDSTGDLLSSTAPYSDDNPLDVLKGMGFKLQHAHQSYDLADTMGKTGYASKRVVRLTDV